jgi:hypothetical protein
VSLLTSADVTRLRLRVADLERALSERDQQLRDAYAARDRDHIEHRRQVEAVRREAFPVAGPPAYPDGVAHEMALLRLALRGAVDRLAAAENRPVHGDKYAKRGAR